MPKKKKKIILLLEHCNIKYSASTRALQSSKYANSQFIGMEKKMDRDYNYFILACKKSEQKLQLRTSQFIGLFSKYQKSMIKTKFSSVSPKINSKGFCGGIEVCEMWFMLLLLIYIIQHKGRADDLHWKITLWKCGISK